MSVWNGSLRRCCGDEEAEKQRVQAGQAAGACRGPVHLYHLRCSWFSENFGFLSQPFNNNSLCILQHCRLLGFSTKTPALTFWPGGRGWGEDGEGQSRMKTKTMWCTMEKRKARGTWDWAFLKSLLLRSFHEQALWFLFSFPPYYALNGVKCSPREHPFFTETSHSCINYSKASSPIYTYFWARGLWLYLKSQLLLSDSIFTRSSLQIMKKDRIFHLWEFTNNTTQLVKPVAYYNFTFYLDDSKCTFSSKVWESSVGRHPSGRL